MLHRVALLAFSLVAAGYPPGFAGDATSAEPLQLANDEAGWRLSYANNGRILALEIKARGQWERIDFRSDDRGGPQWYGQWDGRTHAIPLHPAGKSTTKFTGRSGKLLFWLEYASLGDRLAIVAGIRNDGADYFEPVKAGLKLGLDTYVAAWPEWNRKLFPTLLRCEKTHFWGYAMSPGGRILGLASPDPVASWSLDYEHLRRRIYTLNLDLLNAPPLPPRHPWNRHVLAPGEERRWTIFLVGIEELAEVKPALAGACGAPMFEIDRHTVAQGESARIVVYSDEEVEVKVIPPSGRLRSLPPVDRADRQYHYRLQPDERPGVYRLIAGNRSGKRTEASIYLRRPWSWYLEQARKEALRCPPKASTQAESWGGLSSMLLARRYFPDAKLDAAGEAVFREVFTPVYDREKSTPSAMPGRLQNAAAQCSLLVDRYQCTGELEDLETAAGLAGLLIKHRGPDEGSHDPREHFLLGTFAAKSIMELMAAEKKLAGGSQLWRQRYHAHYQAVREAMDGLVGCETDVRAGGGVQFEDGVIGCSAAQLAMFALLQDDPQLRRKYTDAALCLMRAYRCLAQLAVPDCRTHGATLGFWDAQHDALVRTNMISSPHGRSAWRIYGLWYLYQLTGEEDRLRQATGALGSCLQLIDCDTGRLRRAFVVDPYVEADLLEKDPDRPGHGVRTRRVIGEQYVGMISDWWRAPPGEATGGDWGQGCCCDNGVHEIFKCLAEVALGSAYVVERADGEIVGYNCRVDSRGRRLVVNPAEPVVEAVHVNLRSQRDVTICFSERPMVCQKVVGTRWLRKTR